MTNEKRSPQNKRGPGRPRKVAIAREKEHRAAAASAAMVMEPDPDMAELPARNWIDEEYPALELVPGESEAAKPEAPRKSTRFDRFVDSLTPETRELFDESELARIFEEQQTRAREERRAAARKAVAESALTEARIAEGVIRPATAEEIEWRRRMAEPVFFTVDMPGIGDGLVDIGMRVDQKIYLHGERYQLTRAQYDSMRSNLYVARQNELAFEGKDRRHWLRRQATGRMNGLVESDES